MSVRDDIIRNIYPNRDGLITGQQLQDALLAIETYVSESYDKVDWPTFNSYTGSVSQSLNQKADKTELNALSGSVDQTYAKITTLQQVSSSLAVEKANKSDVSSSVATLSGSIHTVDQKVDQVSQSLGTKLDTGSFNTFSSSVSSSLGTKLDKSTFNSYTGSMSSSMSLMSGSIHSVDQKVDNLSGSVVSQTTFNSFTASVAETYATSESVSQSIAELSESIAGIVSGSGFVTSESLAQYSSSVSESLDGKVDKTDFNSVTASINSLSSSLAGKVDTTTFNTFTSSISSSVGGCVTTSSFNEYTASVESILEGNVDTSSLNDYVPTGSFDTFTGSYEQFSGSVSESLASMSAEIGEVSSGDFRHANKIQIVHGTQTSNLILTHLFNTGNDYQTTIWYPMYSGSVAWSQLTLPGSGSADLAGRYCHIIIDNDLPTSLLDQTFPYRMYSDTGVSGQTTLGYETYGDFILNIPYQFTDGNGGYWDVFYNGLPLETVQAITIPARTICELSVMTDYWMPNPSSSTLWSQYHTYNKRIYLRVASV